MYFASLMLRKLQDFVFIQVMSRVTVPQFKLFSKLGRTSGQFESLSYMSYIVRKWKYWTNKKQRGINRESSLYDCLVLSPNMFVSISYLYCASGDFPRYLFRNVLVYSPWFASIKYNFIMTLLNIVEVRFTHCRTQLCLTVMRWCSDN